MRREPTTRRVEQELVHSQRETEKSVLPPKRVGRGSTLDTTRVLGLGLGLGLGYFIHNFTLLYSTLLYPTLPYDGHGYCYDYGPKEGQASCAHLQAPHKVTNTSTYINVLG